MNQTLIISFSDSYRVMHALLCSAHANAVYYSHHNSMPAILISKRIQRERIETLLSLNIFLPLPRVRLPLTHVECAVIFFHYLNLIVNFHEMFPVRHFSLLCNSLTGMEVKFQWIFDSIGFTLLGCSLFLCPGLSRWFQAETFTGLYPTREFWKLLIKIKTDRRRSCST